MISTCTVLSSVQKVYLLLRTPANCSSSPTIPYVTPFFRYQYQLPITSLTARGPSSGIHSHESWNSTVQLYIQDRTQSALFCMHADHCQQDEKKRNRTKTEQTKQNRTGQNQVNLTDKYCTESKVIITYLTVRSTEYLCIYVYPI